jgi:hypothetical protein
LDFRGVLHPSQALDHAWCAKLKPQYQTLRSVSDNHLFVVCRGGAFYELVPDEVRKQGPWQGMHRGEIELLKPEYRLALARDGYAPVKCEFAVFKPDV